MPRVRDYAAWGLCLVACKDSPDAGDFSQHVSLQTSERVGRLGARPWAGDYLARQVGFEESDNDAYYEFYESDW